MRERKSALMFGLLTLAVYGCGGDGGGKKTDSGAPDGASTNTSTVTSTITPTNTNTNTTTLTTTTTKTSVDGGTGNPDTAVPTGNDGGTGIEVGSTKIEAGSVDVNVTVDVGVGATKLDSATVDGGTIADAPSSGDVPTSTGACNYPQCYIDLIKNCAPGGSCVQQTTISPTLSTNLCYGNGVKMISSIDVTALTTTTTWKNGSGICYTQEAPISVTSGNLTYTLRNAAGAVVATQAIDSTANTMTITCTGASPVVVPNNCGSSSADGGSATCPAGTCAP